MHHGFVSSFWHFLDGRNQKEIASCSTFLLCSSLLAQSPAEDTDDCPPLNSLGVGDRQMLELPEPPAATEPEKEGSQEPHLPFPPHHPAFLPGSSGPLPPPRTLSHCRPQPRSHLQGNHPNLRLHPDFFLTILQPCAFRLTDSSICCILFQQRIFLQPS